MFINAKNELEGMSTHNGVAVLTLSILLAASLSGCGYLKDTEAAELLVADFYTSLKEGDYEAAVAFMDPSWFEKQSKEDLIQFLKVTNEKLGTIENYAVVESKVSPNYINFLYSVNRTQYTTKEIFSILNKPLNPEEFSIVGYRVNVQENDLARFLE